MTATPAWADAGTSQVKASIVAQYAQMQRQQQNNDLPGFFSHLAPHASIDLGFISVSKEQLENYWEHPTVGMNPVKFSAYQVVYKVLDVVQNGNSFVAHVSTHSLVSPAAVQSTGMEQNLAAGFSNANAYATWQNIQGSWLITNIQIQPDDQSATPVSNGATPP